MAVKAWYKIKRNWMGDPCSPKALAWDGLNCSSSLSNPPRITTFTIAFPQDPVSIHSNPAFDSLINGDLVNYHHALACRDLTNNNLDGSIPSPLLTKAQNGELTLRLVLCLKIRLLVDSPHLVGSKTYD
ncbi:hypothetical protein GW17_00047278 [Ensete ventricosum]|nr:hypothetical protein GW17_00047278 [Ensete ventricosum]